MVFFLNEFFAGTTSFEFCTIIRNQILSHDIYGQYPTHNEINELFNIYDLDKDGVLSISEAEKANENLIRKINLLSSALIIVDFQNDFISGSLSIKHGPANQNPMDVLPSLNSLLKQQSQFKRIIYTMDWHPYNHISFYEHCRNADRVLCNQDKSRKLKPFDVVNFKNLNFKQVLYPTHCVQNSWGAELCAELIRAENAKYILKGNQVFVDSYSAFFDNQGENRNELESILKQEKIEVLFICGLALDICVAETTKDAANLNFLTAIIVDCSKGLNAEQIETTRKNLLNLNVAFLDSSSVKSFIDHRRLPWRWICQLVGNKSKDLKFINAKKNNNLQEKSHVS